MFLMNFHQRFIGRAWFSRYKTHLLSTFSFDNLTGDNREEQFNLVFDQEIRFLEFYDQTRGVPVATLTLFYIRVSYTKVNHNSFFIRGFLHVLRRTRFFARLGARLGAPQRRASARRGAKRRVQRTWYVHNVFTEPTCRKCVPARANRRRTRTRIALLTVHNSSSRFLCP